MRFDHFKCQRSLWRLLPFLSTLFISCAGGERELLKVKQFHLRDTKIAGSNARMVRGEQQYRLRGAVTNKEKRERLGSYYTMYWNVPDTTGENMKIIFDFHQAISASELLTMSYDIPQGKRSGVTDFIVSGKAYREGGSVLAWRARLMKGEELLSVKRSYLWR